MGSGVEVEMENRWRPQGCRRRKQTKEPTSERPIGRLLSQSGGPVANTPITTMRETIAFAIIFAIIFAIVFATISAGVASQKRFYYYSGLAPRHQKSRPAYQRLLAGVHHLCYLRAALFPSLLVCRHVCMEGEMIPCMIAFTVPASSIAICMCSHAHLPQSSATYKACYPD